MKIVRPILASLLVTLLVGLSSLAEAQGCPESARGCHRAAVAFEHRDALLERVTLDSGWVPAGAPLQVRFGIEGARLTELDLDGEVVTTCPAPLTVGVHGTPQGGRLAMDYGLEVTARIRFDVTVAGVRYRWEGDIPLPHGVPRDLRMADAARFDPFVLPPRDAILIEDATDRFTLYDTSLTDSLIPIAGISGGFRADAELSLVTRYRSLEMRIEDAESIITEGGTTRLGPPEGETRFGAHRRFEVSPRGELRYDADFTFFPTLYVRVAGTRFDLTLAEVPLRVVARTVEPEFEWSEVHVPLPDLLLAPRDIAFGALPVGAMAERLVDVENRGEETLLLELLRPEPPFEIPTEVLVVPPRSTARLPVRFAPESPHHFEAVVSVQTNDPDEAVLFLSLSGEGTTPLQEDAGVPTVDGGLAPPPLDAGCGCRAGAGSSHAGLAMLFALVAWFRRRAGSRG